MIELIIGTIVCVGGGAVGVLPMIMSPMMFDAPGSEKNIALITVFLAVISFPFVCAGVVMAAWIDHFWGSGRTFWIYLPLINIVVGILGFKIGAIVQKQHLDGKKA